MKCSWSDFDTTTKKSIVVYDTSDTDNPSGDLFVAAVSPFLSSEAPNDILVYYQIFTANVEITDNNLAGFVLCCNRSCRIGSC